MLAFLEIYSSYENLKESKTTIREGCLLRRPLKRGSKLLARVLRMKSLSLMLVKRVSSGRSN